MLDAQLQKNREVLVTSLKEPKRLTPDIHASANGHAAGNGRAAFPPIIVVGMHRSGTSFVSSLLHSAGLNMGERLMPGGRGNDRGHFENLDFVEFHMRWLRLTGHDDSGWTTQASIALPEDAIADAREILAANARNIAWGWKDPRTTLFLDFWSTLLPEARFLFVYREPSEVIDSLFRRGDAAIRHSPELAAKAYLRHNAMILEFARNNPQRCLLANVSAVADEPKKFLESVAKSFGVELDTETSSPFERDAMLADKADSARPVLVRYLLPDIGRVYANLERDADFPAKQAVNKKPSARRAAGALLAEWFAQRHAVADLESRSADRENLRQSLAQMQASYESRGAEIENLVAELERERAQLAQHQAAYAKRDADFAHVAAELERERAQLVQHQAAYAKRDADFASVAAELERSNAILAESTKTLSEQRAALDEADRRQGLAREQTATLRRDIARELARSNELQQQLEVATGSCDAYQDELSRVRLQVEARSAELATARAELESAVRTSQELRERLDAASQELVRQTEFVLQATQAECERVALLIHTAQSSHFWKLKRALGRMRGFFRIGRVRVRE